MMLYCLMDLLVADGSNWFQSSVRTIVPAPRAALIGCWQLEREREKMKIEHYDLFRSIINSVTKRKLSDGIQAMYYTTTLPL